MAKNVTQYDLLISCPGDILSEIDIIERVVDQFNQQYSDTLGISIRTRHWSKSSYPQSGANPQELLNQQFVRDCDAAVAVFWTRFGTPTDQYGSGSEEEIEIMLEAKKQVFLYFSEKPIVPSDIDTDQYQKVKSFKSKYKTLGLFSSYSSDAEFERLLFAHLSQYFLTLSKISELEGKAKPVLSIKSIHEGQLCDTAHIEKFALNSEKNSQQLLDDIKSLFHVVKQNKLMPYSNTMGTAIGAFHFNKPAEIEEETKELIKKVAEHMSIDITEDFFNLGNLSENPLGNISMIGARRTFDGTTNEKRKYFDIIKLKQLIGDASHWMPIEKCFENLNCLKFVLSNDGTTFDEDIDVELDFGIDMLLPHQALPIPQETSLRYACDDCSLPDLFGIEATAIYMDYDSSRKPLSSPVSYSDRIPFNPLAGRDYEEDYQDTMDEVFEYQYYQQGASTILKLHVDYIKQHTAVAFPTPIFVTDKQYDIKYRITSKHNPEVVSGIVKIG